MRWKAKLINSPRTGKVGAEPIDSKIIDVEAVNSQETIDNGKLQCDEGWTLESVWPHSTSTRPPDER